ncbi:MAG: SGNH/GDSL hydrolase family protein [Candidatus Limnocylindrales bacterium]
MVAPNRLRVAALLRLLACAGLFGLAGCGATAGPTCASSQSAACVHILFLGNSYTYVNDLPGTFARLANSGGRAVEVATVANGGETLAQHSASSESMNRLASQGWSFVVLQEQSETPATPAGRGYMYPAARTLAGRIRASGGAPLFFMTWAHRDGLPTSGMRGYESMQLAIDDGYQGIARELGVAVAPVGYTWSVVRREHPEIGLWQDDGSHPSAAGTYLAACVFYAAIFRHSPAGLSFEADLSDAEARVLQADAGDTVLELQGQWGLR